MSNFTLFFDDSGSKSVDIEKDPQSFWFAQGGYIIRNDNIEILTTNINDFIIKWTLKLGRSIPPLHSNDIRRKKEGFEFLKDPLTYSQFMGDLTQLISSAPIYIIGSIISRKGYLEYTSSQGYINSVWNYYDTAYPILIERSLKFINSIEGDDFNLYVVGEKTGKHEDKHIANIHDNLIKGHNYFKPETSSKYGYFDDYFKIKGLKFNNKSSKLLQIADLVLYPICQAIISVNQSSGLIYHPFIQLNDAGMLINNHIDFEQIKYKGIKYYCFDKQDVEIITNLTCKK